MNIKQEIENQKKTIEDIEKNLKFKELFDNMNNRIKVVEELLRMNKKGSSNMDPRIIMIVILIILFVLFLRSIGKI